MITKNDCLMLLSDLKARGIEVNPQMKLLLKSPEVPLEVIRFINQKRELALSEFYQKLRKSYNQKKNKLYINIVKEEQKDPKEVLTTLAALNLHILLFSKTIEENTDIFLRQARFQEINQCLSNYANTGDLIACQKLLKCIKADLKCLEIFYKENNKSK